MNTRQAKKLYKKLSQTLTGLDLDGWYLHRGKLVLLTKQGIDYPVVKRHC